MPAFETIFPIELDKVGLGPTPPAVALLGDSISDQNTEDGEANAWAYNTKGYMSWAIAILRGRVKFPLPWNFGISGQTSTAIAARVGDVVAVRPGWCAVLAGINDIYATSTPFDPETTWANLQTIYDALLNAGIRVLALPILPTSSQGSMTNDEFAQKRAGLQWINRRIRAYAATKSYGLVVVPACDQAIQALGGTGYAPLPLYTADGLHPIGIAAYWLGKAIADAWLPFIDAPPAFIGGYANTFDAVWNPTGNMIPTGQFFGTSGTAGAGCSGDVATSWNLARTSGTTVTAVGSKETEDARLGSVRQVITLGGPGSGASSELIALSRNIVSSNGFVEGDILQGSIEVEFSDVSQARTVQLRVQSGATRYVGLNGSGNNGDALPAATPGKILIQTPEFVMGSATTLTIALEIGFAAGSAPIGVFKVGNAWLGRVAP